MKKSIRDHTFELSCKDVVIKEENNDTISISGTANGSEKDRVGDVILPKAWENGMTSYIKNPIILAFHDATRPIGEMVSYNIDKKGLHISAEISKASGDVYSLIKAGILKAFSVGFRVKDATYDEKTDIFVIKELDLYEISVVSIPAQQDSLFSVAKELNNQDYDEFKQQYTTQVATPDNILDKNLDNQVIKPVIKENIKVDKTFTQEELEAAQAIAVEKALAEIEVKKAKEAELEAMVIKVGKSSEERLLADFEAKLADKDATVAAAMDEFRTEIKEKNAELAALMNSKMTFSNPEHKKAVFTDQEIDTAVMTSKALGVPVSETKYFKELMSTKAAGEHVDQMGGISASAGEEWENLFSTRMYQDIQDKTVIEPLFTNRIKMNSRSMVFPYNPEAGLAAWVAEGAYRGANSTGTEVVHEPQDNTIKAEKLAAKEYLGYEEEEDAIIALAPIIRDAVMRRMVRSTDTELLRANSGSPTTGASSGSALINGITVIASDINGGADYQYVQPGSYGDPTTIADLQQTRRLMGSAGLMPGDLVYVVSQSVYFDLLEDPDFRTMDLVGAGATILTGQVGSVNGSPVVISDGFISDAASTVQACCFNSRNYLFGELRGLMVERDRDIEQQKNILVATRRFGMTEIVPTVVSATRALSHCANLVRAA